MNHVKQNTDQAKVFDNSLIKNFNEHLTNNEN